MKTASHRPLRSLAVIPCALSLAACASDDASLEADARPVIEHYADSVHAAYEQSIAGAGELRGAIDALIASPSADTLATARSTWIEVRSPYGQTEGFRFYDGPIDDAEDGPEGQINAWPMDEVYVDYVVDDPDAGIVNDPDTEITAEVLASLNEVDGEANIATGWHAIEFLLWGQDLAADGPGVRPFEDYTTAPNADRRKQYLDVVTDLLVADLERVEAAWEPGAGTYGDEFAALDAEEALNRMLTGIGKLAGGELSGERINVAYNTKLQEDEHSCFSDNTHSDILDNFLSIRHVYLGEVAGTDGPGIDELVETRDPELAARIQTRLDELESSIRMMPKPFDQAILGADADPGRVAVKHIADELIALGDDLVDVAALFGLSLSTEV
ncbi:MAG: iron-regulated protein [Deltaproteobacteria bacterium]|nr:iron-regulated protein [Nannocystaceae bacterium]